MAGALGLTSSDLTQDVVMARKHNIHIKLRQGGILRFTMVITPDTLYFKEIIFQDVHLAVYLYVSFYKVK